MSLHHWVLVLHLLGATVWTGGHLILATIILPRALKSRTVEQLRDFESGYERIGIPALLLQIVSGLWLANRFVPVNAWLNFDSGPSRAVMLKVGLLVLTALFAADARLRIIPRLTSERLGSLAMHIIPVTVVSVLFVLVGVSFRVGGW